MRKLLLDSNSTQHGRGYLDHVLEGILSTLDGARRVLFVPFALKDRAGYAAPGQTQSLPEGGCPGW